MFCVAQSPTQLPLQWVVGPSVPLEDFVTNVLRADLAIDTSARTTPPEMSFVSMSPYCIPLRASQVPLTDLLHPETKSYNVFLRPDSVPKSKLITALETIDRKLKFPLLIPAGTELPPLLKKFPHVTPL